jgi:hypothetical protein
MSRGGETNPRLRQRGSVNDLAVARGTKLVGELHPSTRGARMDTLPTASKPRQDGCQLSTAMELSERGAARAAFTFENGLDREEMREGQRNDP